MSLGGRPLTIITAQMLQTVETLGPRAVIVARRSRCGRYVTYQAATLDDAYTVTELATGCAVIVADLDDVRHYTRTYPGGPGVVIAQRASRLTATL